MFSLGYALFSQGYYDRLAGVIFGILDVIAEGFLLFALMSSSC